MDLVSRTLSPRGYKLFYWVMVPLFIVSGYQLYMQSGPVWSLLIWAADSVGPGRWKIDNRLAFIVLIFPVIAIGVAVAYLHDFIFKLGVFGPKQPKQPLPPRPYDRMRDW